MTIVGAGPEYAKLLELCSALGLEDEVSFVGAQPQDAIIKSLQCADVFILSSRSEGLPVVCMEAMAMQVFMIATRINGIPELVIHEQNGLLVEPEDVDGLTQAICWVDQNRSPAKKMCETARIKVVKEFNRKKCTEILLKNISSNERNKSC